MVLWFGPSTFQNLAIHVSTVRCQYEESKRTDLKTQRLVCWEHEKLEPGNTAVKLRFRSEDDYPVRNIDEPVRLSNEPARIGGPVRLRNEPVRVVKNLFNYGIWRTDPTPREKLCFPSRSIRYGFEQSRLISQARGFITWLEFLSFSYLLRKPSTIWRETYRLKNPETGVLGTRKIGTGEYCRKTSVQI